MTHCTDCTECILPSFVVMPFLKPTKLSTFPSPSPSLGIGYARNGDKCINIEWSARDWPLSLDKV